MKCCFKLFPHFHPIHAIVNHTIPCSISNSSWLVDLSASHHVIIDLSNLTLHYEYGGLNDIVLGDGKGLSITYIGCVNLFIPSSTKIISLQNVLCVSSMQDNLIFVSKFCYWHNASIEFFPSYFQVKDLCTRALLLQGQNKDGVYEWMQPIFAFRNFLLAFCHP